MRSTKFALLGVLLMGLIQGCDSKSGMDDLEVFLAEVDARPKGRIEPLPAIEQYTLFAYSAASMRSPFEPPVVIKAVKRGKGDPKVKPDFNRVKHYLEQFNVGELKMVGTLAQGNIFYALVSDSEGGVHRVRIGDYMGTNFGKVTDVNEGEIELLEIVSDGLGGWIQRGRTITMGSAEV
ncbi:MAG: pilus assembly protein PilP [Pseudomonadales bacterium]|nr:pilus assembly protein PilP [Pseudomonadales bacterium]